MIKDPDAAGSGGPFLGPDRGAVDPFRHATEIARRYQMLQICKILLTICHNLLLFRVLVSSAGKP